MNNKWYNEAVFYHIYPLGMTGAPKQNAYGAPEHRLNTLIPFIGEIKNGDFNELIEALMQKPVEELKELYNNRDIEK